MYVNLVLLQCIYMCELLFQFNSTVYFTAQLVELGRADASAQQDRILELLAG